MRGFRVLAASAVVIATSLIIHADTSRSTEIQLQLGNLLFEQGQYIDALEAYQHALGGDDSTVVREARSGVIRSALSMAEFGLARREADTLVQMAPKDPAALALSGDAIWSAGLFDKAEARYRDALAMAPDLARAHHGVARSLLSRGQLAQAMDEAQAALRLAPRDFEIHHTVGAIYERMHKFEEAAAAFGNFVNLLPNKDTSIKAAWSRAEIQFLRSFGQRVPFEVDPATADEIHTVDFKLVNSKVVVRARVNNEPLQDFVVDTGAENTVISERTAERLRIKSDASTISAGVGDAGLRGLQLGRLNSLEIGGLKLHNVPTIIKDPGLRNIPGKEVESLSPLSLGYSMTIDYRTNQLTFGKHLHPEPADFELPLRLYRLAIVQGLVSGNHDANFVVDTGGSAISLSQATVAAIGKAGARRIPLRVWGSSGWDRDAFLLTGIDLSFNAIRYDSSSVVVLNLDAPSVLLGYQLGGIVGHRFLSNYRVTIDLERSVLRLKSLS